MSVTKQKRVKKNEDDPVVTVSILNAVLETRFKAEFSAFSIEMDKKLDKKLDEKLDEKLNKQRLEYERYMGALAEDFNGKISAMGEGINLILELFSKNNEENAREHELFKMKLARLEAKVF